MLVLTVVCICLAYLCIGWISTTDILRLCRGAEAPILYIRCCCDSCGAVIPIKEQIPIVTYLLAGGRCQYCDARIPPIPLLLELLAFIPPAIITAVFSFRAIGVFFAFVYYELLKLCCLKARGRREREFVKNYMISFGMNVLCFGMIALMTVFASMAK